MAITIKEIQVKTIVERNVLDPVFSQEIIRKIKSDILKEIRSSKPMQHPRNRKER